MKIIFPGFRRFFKAADRENQYLSILCRSKYPICSAHMSDYISLHLIMHPQSMFELPE